LRARNLEISARNASRVGEMDNERPVTDEGANIGFGAGVEIRVGADKRVAVDGAVLSREIAYLASLWEGGIAGRAIAAEEGIQVP
jgi:hypothetical protein